MTKELENWCREKGLNPNIFEEVFGDQLPTPKWVEEVYKLGSRSQEPHIINLEAQIDGYKLTLSNIGKHLHLETKRRWWQRKTNE